MRLANMVPGKGPVAFSAFLARSLVQPIFQPDCVQPSAAVMAPCRLKARSMAGGSPSGNSARRCSPRRAAVKASMMDVSLIRIA